MARTARPAKPGISHDARDKLMAALNCPYGKMKDSCTYRCAPMYFDACPEWHERLSENDQENLLHARQAGHMYEIRRLDDSISFAIIDLESGTAVWEGQAKQEGDRVCI
jgi:hypothetical protein